MEKEQYIAPAPWYDKENAGRNIPMKQSMKEWFRRQIGAADKKPLPLLSFPCVQLMGCTVRELISSADLQARGMALVAQRTPSAASVSLMDLSVEAEAFGSAVHITDHEVPTVVGAIVTSEEEAEALEIPAVGAGRTGLCVEAIRKACETITDRPVLAGVIGPYSLAGRLMDVTEIMYLCFDEPETVHAVLEKCAAFTVSYCEAFRAAGASGVVIAEPLAGLLSPALAAEFSHPYVRRIIEAVQTEEFAVIYHNCGDNTPKMAEEIFALGAMGYHFGDAVSMAELLPKAPADALVMGNISPSAQLLGGTPESVREATRQLLAQCGGYPNFLLSSGCDVPPAAPWENIDAFFAAAAE